MKIDYLIFSLLSSLFVSSSSVFMKLNQNVFLIISRSYLRMEFVDSKTRSLGQISVNTSVAIVLLRSS